MSSRHLTTEHCDVIASWPWIAEVIRATCCQLYALGGYNDSQRQPRHSNEILSEVRRRLGEIDAFSPEKDSLRAIFRLLLRLGDFAHIGRGAYIPRETRILLFSPTYARIAGGLPLQFSEYRDERIVLCESETIGRIATTSEESDGFLADWSFARCFTWGRMSIPERVEMLTSKARKQTPSITQNIVFYNPTAHSYYRGSRWQNIRPRQKYSIARLSGNTNSYFLISDCGSNAERWFEVSYEDAKYWWVVIDQMAGAVHSVKCQVECGIIRLSLPMNMPDFCIEAMASASSHLRYEGYLWHFCIPASLSPLIDYVCSITALHQYE